MMLAGASVSRVRKYYKQEAEQHIEALLGIYINCQSTGIRVQGNEFY